MQHYDPSMSPWDARYGFGVGNIRALETRLIDETMLARLLEAGSLKDLEGELEETEYSQVISLSNDLQDPEAMLQAELKRVYDLVHSMDPDPALTDLFRYRYDIHNLKTCYKAQLIGEDPGPALTDLGLYPVEEIKRMIAEEDMGGLTPELSAMMEELLPKLKDAPDSRSVEMLFDNAQYSFLYAQAQRKNNCFLEGYLQFQIDLINLKTWLRIYKMKGNRKLLEQALLDHGLLDREWWLDIYGGGIGELISRMSYTPYSDLADAEVISEDGNLVELERLTDDYLLDYVKIVSYVSMGVEPLIAYILAKENEVKVLRILLVGKLNHLPKEEIRMRLRKLYA